ncbi:DUF2330 domain-containing protein [Streptomyces sp. NPDC048751]|uniref:DUF2330 domain-containing protein n=1 Tax=Streptomyces sp. NPDC048751 TaxID=3365591 RepID=UPI0037112985
MGDSGGSEFSVGPGGSGVLGEAPGPGGSLGPGRAPGSRRFPGSPVRVRRVRVLAVVLALFALQLGSLVAPAYACGCGALVPGARQQVFVGREVSVVRWDGLQEQIVMRLSVTGDADRAAWIMPVPRRATVKLGDPALFDELAAATAPTERTRYHFWPQDGDWPLTTGDGAGARPPGRGVGAARPEVGVVGRQRLGPFDVARLTATDPGALDGWLRTNGFAFPPRLVGQEFPTPTTISGDHELRRAATDAPYRQVIYQERLRTVGGTPAWLLTVGGGLAALTVGVVWLTLRPRSRLRPASPDPIG